MERNWSLRISLTENVLENGNAVRNVWYTYVITRFISALNKQELLIQTVQVTP